jgi:hypothetical protein
MIKRIAIFSLVILLTACSSPDINNYSGTTPELKLETFFNGKLTAHGVVLDKTDNLLVVLASIYSAHGKAMRVN